MRSDIFIEWLHYLDNWFRTMGRKVALLIDNAGSHFNPKILEDLSGDSNDEEEMNIAESSHSAQNKNKRKKNLISSLLILSLFTFLLIPRHTFSLWMQELSIVLKPNTNENFVDI